MMKLSDSTFEKLIISDFDYPIHRNCPDIPQSLSEKPVIFVAAFWHITTHFT